MPVKPVVDFVWSTNACHVCNLRAQPSSGRQNASGKVITNSIGNAAGALAGNRAKHTSESGASFRDAYAAQLAAAVSQDKGPNSTSEAEDVKATAYIDQQLITALDLVDLDLKKEYRQVVLLGCGFDTRPYRLLWPEGTVIYEIAPSDVHTTAYRSLKEQKACVSRGSIFRRVPWEFQADTTFEAALTRAGHQGSRLSVWGIQGLTGMQLDMAALKDLLTQVSMASAFGSIVVGELPAMTQQEAEQLLAEQSLLGIVKPVLEGNDTKDKSIPQRWLFTTQHKSLSSDEMETYERHISAAEELDEDFFDNFS